MACVTTGVLTVGPLPELTRTWTEIKYGLGSDAIPAGMKSTFLRALWATVIIYYTTQLLVKCSILAQYYRIFSTQKARRIMVPFFAWLVVVGLVGIILSIVTCVPVEHYWNPDSPGECMSISTVHTFVAQAQGSESVRWDGLTPLLPAVFWPLSTSSTIGPFSSFPSHS